MSAKNVNFAFKQTKCLSVWSNSNDQAKEQRISLILPYSALIIAFGVAALVAAFLLSWLLATSYKYGIFDQPSERKIHKNNIPRLGGVAFVPAAITGYCGATFLARFEGSPLPNPSSNTSIILLGCLIIYAVGIFDDLFGTTAKTKLTIQIIAALCLPLGGLYIDNLYGFAGIHELPYFLGVSLTVFVTILITNALNLIDGIDGLAASLALVALVTFGVLFYKCAETNLTICCTSLCGALCVFLLFNVWGDAAKQRKTFMGDSGSLLLGTIISCLAVKYAIVQSSALPPRPDGLLIAFTLPLIPCLDLCRVAIDRIRRRQGIFSADKTHLHHILMAKGLSMHATLITIVGLQIAFTILNIVLYHVGVEIHWILSADIVVFFLFTFRVLRFR